MKFFHVINIITESGVSQFERRAPGEAPPTCVCVVWLWNAASALLSKSYSFINNKLIIYQHNLEEKWGGNMVGVSGALVAPPVPPYKKKEEHIEQPLQPVSGWMIKKQLSYTQCSTVTRGQARGREALLCTLTVKDTFFLHKLYHEGHKSSS